LRDRLKLSSTPYANLVHVDIGEIVPVVQKEMGFGWGCVTVLHFLTDLGLACKPDLHLVRSARHLGIWNGSENPSCPEFIEIVRRVRSLVEQLDGSLSPARLRYVDKILMEIDKCGLIGASPASPRSA
jgi:hypothetical protein